MSADEIRRLAQQAATDKITNKAASHYGMAESCSMYETALLDFAGVVERCEEVKSKYCLARNRIDKTLAPHFDSTYAEINSTIAQLDYILRGDAGKEER